MLKRSSKRPDKGGPSGDLDGSGISSVVPVAITSKNGILVILVAIFLFVMSMNVVIFKTGAVQSNKSSYISGLGAVKNKIGDQIIPEIVNDNYIKTRGKEMQWPLSTNLLAKTSLNSDQDVNRLRKEEESRLTENQGGGGGGGGGDVPNWNIPPPSLPSSEIAKEDAHIVKEDIKPLANELELHTLQLKANELIDSIRKLKGERVVMETDIHAKELIAQLQDNLRKLVPLMYGQPPYFLEMELTFPDTMPDASTAGKRARILIELASIEYVPYCVYYFLQIVDSWKGGSFHRNAGHVLQAQTKVNFAGLAFQEYHPNNPHVKFTLGYAGRPGGPAFYISTVDNSANHGPGSQGSNTEADGCFGRVMSYMLHNDSPDVYKTGYDVVRRMQRQPGADKRMGFVLGEQNFIEISNIRLLTREEQGVVVLERENQQIPSVGEKMRGLANSKENAPPIVLKTSNTKHLSNNNNNYGNDNINKDVIVHRQIEYGIFNKYPSRVPVVMIRSRLDEEVYGRFLKSPLFNCSSEQDMNTNGLKKTVDYPKSAKSHTYYEGYYHAVPGVSSTYFSRNPRTGKDFLKTPAGDFIRAFFHSLRNINHDLFKTLETKLYTSALTRNPSNPYNDSCGYVAKWLSKGLHFSDLSVQIHWGSAIKGDELFWHSDAENSLLHFGLTVRGERILHSKRSPTPDGEVKEILETQRPGDVYMSSSALMNHAPEYPKTDFLNRIVAIQSRIIYETSELHSFRDQRTPDAWTSLVKILAETLSSHQLEVPTMQNINDAMVSMR